MEHLPTCREEAQKLQMTHLVPVSPHTQSQHTSGQMHQIAQTFWGAGSTQDAGNHSLPLSTNKALGGVHWRAPFWNISVEPGMWASPGQSAEAGWPSLQRPQVRAKAFMETRADPQQI